MHYDEFTTPVNYTNENGFIVSVSDYVNLLNRYKQLYKLLSEYMTPEEIDNILNKKGSI